jgi:hypothetical protein
LSGGLADAAPLIAVVAGGQIRCTRLRSDILKAEILFGDNSLMSNVKPGISSKHKSRKTSGDSGQLAARARVPPIPPRTAPRRDI